MPILLHRLQRQLAQACSLELAEWQNRIWIFAVAGAVAVERTVSELQMGLQPALVNL
jgi:hypothetical protein